MDRAMRSLTEAWRQTASPPAAPPPPKDSPITSTLSPASALVRRGGSTDSSNKQSSSKQSACRPWDRSDLMTRLATFKPTLWFAKPEPAGPVECARRGWAVVEMDLLECEACHARLAFPLPPTLPSDQEEFSSRLDKGHHSLCPWRGNACAPDLARFPPTPAAVLVAEFKARCDSLEQLAELPAISDDAVQFMASCCGDARNAAEGSADTPSKVNGITSPGYAEAQRLIALCGWSAQVMPYGVEARSEPKASSSSISPASVWPLQRDVKTNTAAAVLHCSMCEANVGLWDCKQGPRKPVAAALAQVSAQEEDTTTDPTIAQPSETAKPEAKSPTQPRWVADLSRTIAGGPSPVDPGASPFGLFGSPAAKNFPFGMQLGSSLILDSAPIPQPDFSAGDAQDKVEEAGDKRKRGDDAEPDNEPSKRQHASNGDTAQDDDNNACVVPHQQGEGAFQSQLPLETPFSFHPLHMHRRFCPWIAGGTSTSPCGWRACWKALQSTAVVENNGNTVHASPSSEQRTLKESAEALRSMRVLLDRVTAVTPPRKTT
eukprot:jgi/Chlat1/542/Chrsp103S01116